MARWTELRSLDGRLASDVADTMWRRAAAESMLCQLWAENLGLERVGIRDNYFEVGGDSLLATRLISRVSASFGLDVPIKTLFEHSTVETFAIALNGLTSTAVTEIPKADLDRYRARSSECNLDNG